MVVLPYSMTQKYFWKIGSEHNDLNVCEENEKECELEVQADLCLNDNSGPF